MINVKKRFYRDKYTESLGKSFFTFKIYFEIFVTDISWNGRYSSKVPHKELNECTSILP